jgi:hypothetical protein
MSALIKVCAYDVPEGEYCNILVTSIVEINAELIPKIETYLRRYKEVRFNLPLGTRYRSNILSDSYSIQSIKYFLNFDHAYNNTNFNLCNALFTDMEIRNYETYVRQLFKKYRECETCTSKLLEELKNCENDGFLNTDSFYKIGGIKNRIDKLLYKPILSKLTNNLDKNLVLLIGSYL